MSIKIYEAYRFPVSGLNKFLDHVRPRMLRGFYEKVKFLLTLFTEDEISEMEEEVKTWSHVNASNEEEVQSSIDFLKKCKLIERMREASRSSQTLLYDVESGWSFWIYESHVYAIPYTPFEHGAKELEWVEDFSYWNNTDRPDDIGKVTWEFRRVIWEKVNLHSVDAWPARRLYHEVISCAGAVPSEPVASLLCHGDLDRMIEECQEN